MCFVANLWNMVRYIIYVIISRVKGWVNFHKIFSKEKIRKAASPSANVHTTFIYSIKSRFKMHDVNRFKWSNLSLLSFQRGNTIFGTFNYNNMGRGEIVRWNTNTCISFFALAFRIKSWHLIFLPPNDDTLKRYNT